MKRHTAFSALQTLPSTFLNEFQDRALGALAANSNNDLSALAAGVDAVLWQPTAALANATLVTLDTDKDWRDRYVLCFTLALDNLNKRIGQSNDYLCNNDSLAGQFFAYGYLGTGALSNTTTGALVTNGNPPAARGTGAGGTNYFVSLFYSGSGGPDLRLYAEPTAGGGAGSLRLYNSSGASVQPIVAVLAFGDSGKR